ncbi:MAG: Rrf2 family transcriptional regulator [Bacteroidota bacterium]|nr:Rrf2 family transcriptional regulator [Bacteroidota bacterium]
MFSKACEYGIRATLYIAVRSRQDERAGLKDISREIDSPEPFTAKILQQLTRSGIIDSHKGPSGGFAIDKEKLQKIRLSQVVFAIDGDGIYKTCGLGLKACSEKQPCPVHNKFKKIREELKDLLDNTNLEDLAIKLKSGTTFLKI